MKLVYCTIGLVVLAFVGGFSAEKSFALDTEACQNFPHWWGENVSCKGLLELEDMGSFDTEGNWTWKDGFQDDYLYKDFSGALDDVMQNGFGVITPIKSDNSLNIKWKRVDNKRYPNDLAINFYETSSRIVLTGTKGGFSIPQIWLMGIEDPANFNHENCWYFHGLGDGDGDGIDDAYTASDYPVDIFHTDQNENGNIIFITTGAQPIHTTDFEKIVWHETGKEIFPWYVENDEFYFMNYNTGLNRLEYIFTGNDDGNVYFTHFDQLVPKGVNTFTVYPTNDQSFTFTVNIPSDTIMPTVAKTYDYTVDRVNKSGRVIQTGQTITDYNMKVREITNNDGQICLLVQFNEPDGAMMLTNPYTRLRLFIGHGWFHSPQPQQGEIADLSFLWVDVPLQTGSVVIPPEAYQWAKDKLASKGLTTLEIGGMYREQYNCLGDDCVQYHNRGYISGTTFGLTQ